MIVWGGTAGSEGARYDPLVDRWELIAPAPLSGRVDHTAVWTGAAMIVWGGGPTSGGFGYDDGASYDPVKDTWTELSEPPIAGRYRHVAVWAEVGMIVWGGSGQEHEGSISLADGAVYRPAEA
jgi:hypothetical protein